MNADKRTLYIHEVALYCHSSESLVEYLIQSGMIHSDDKSMDEFLESSDLETIRRAARLEHDFGVNAEGIDIILHMRNQIASLQREMDILKRYYSQFDDGNISFIDAGE